MLSSDMQQDIDELVGEYGVLVAACELASGSGAIRALIRTTSHENRLAYSRFASASHEARAWKVRGKV